jgi:predicted nucleic acid-binding protein
VSETVVVNASPLIFLGRAERLELLRLFSGRVLVPEMVWAEILRRGEGDPAVSALTNAAGWIEIVEAPEIPPSVQAWGLGPGESAVLALSLQEGNATAVLDDLAARRCAAALGVPLRGTLGIVLAAKRQGRIPAARPVLEHLLRTGLYLSRPVLDEALRRVGE